MNCHEQPISNELEWNGTFWMDIPQFCPEHTSLFMTSNCSFFQAYRWVRSLELESNNHRQQQHLQGVVKKEIWVWISQNMEWPHQGFKKCNMGIMFFMAGLLKENEHPLKHIFGSCNIMATGQVLCLNSRCLRGKWIETAWNWVLGTPCHRHEGS